MSLKDFLKALLLPFLIGALPLLGILEKNPGEVWGLDFAISLMILGLFCSGLVILFYGIKKQILKASLASAVFWIPLYIVSELTPLHTNYAFWSISASLSFIIIYSPINEAIFHRILRITIVPIALISAMLSFSIIRSKYSIHCSLAELQKEMDYQLDRSELSFCKNADTPDIYFLVLDEFISETAFNNYYKHDNNTFFSSLRNSGFHIIEQSYSNYPWTIPSISSMLMLDYHKTYVSKKSFPKIAHYLILNNITSRLLKLGGYHYFPFPSIYWLGNEDKGLWNDFIFRTKSYGFILSLLRSTPLASLARSMQKKYHRAHFLNQLDGLKNLAANSRQKKFVFAHFLCPHRPNVFDKDGNELDLSLEKISDKDPNHAFYLDQACYVSNALLHTIECIKKSSTKPPIILLLSDHGRFPIGVSAKGKRTLPLEHLSWRFSNFMAFYLPDSDITLPQIMTPVNSLRLVLNEYFDFNLPYLEDYYHPDFFDFEQKGVITNLLPYQSELNIQ